MFWWLPALNFNTCVKVMYMIFCGLLRLCFVELMASAFCACYTAAAQCLRIAATLPVLWKCIHFSGRWDVIGCSIECLSDERTDVDWAANLSLSCVPNPGLGVTWILRRL